MRWLAFFGASLACLVPGLASAQGLPAPPPESPFSPATARLHVDGPERAEIEGRPNEDAKWALVCTGACDRDVPLVWQYRVRGAGMKASDELWLDALAGDHVVLKVKPASKGWYIAGAVAVPTGLGGGYAAIFLLLLSRQSIDQTVTDVEIVASVAGVLVVTGMVAMLTNLKTRVTQTDVTAPPPPQPAHRPTWHTSELREVPTLPSASLPLLTLTF
jgi:hypothetical protein